MKFGEQRSEFKVADKGNAKKAAVTDRALIKRNPRFCIGTTGKMPWGQDSAN